MGSWKIPHVCHISVLFKVCHTLSKNAEAYFSYPFSKNEIEPVFKPPAEIPVITSYATSSLGIISTI